MPFRRIRRRNSMLAVVNLVFLFWAAETIVAFQGISRQPAFGSNNHQSKTALSASIPTTKKKQSQRFGKVVFDGTSTPFRDHLNKLSSQAKKNRCLAQHMDDDLKRMETQYYNLSEADAPICSHPESPFQYDGPNTRPDAGCYRTVIHAYANAQNGTEGAFLAESAVRRYESYQDEYADRGLLHEVLQAWVAVRNLEKASDLLKLMEDRFYETKDIDLAPDTRMYSLVTAGLANVGASDKARTAKLASDALLRMRNRYLSGDNPIAIPNRYIYTHVMLCEARVKSGSESFYRVDSLYRQLEEDYRMLKHDNLKPDALSALALFQSAVNNSGDPKVVERAFEVWDSLRVRYIEKGDLSYRPVEKMYKYLFSAVTRLGSENAREFSSRLRNLLKAMRSDGLVPSVQTMALAIEATAIQQNGRSLEEAEEMMRSLESPEVATYETCK
eukprot:scaffold2149_cov187-Cylindrotheca_fusiformis.AAC.4